MVFFRSDNSILSTCTDFSQLSFFSHSSFWVSARMWTECCNGVTNLPHTLRFTDRYVPLYTHAYLCVCKCVLCRGKQGAPWMAPWLASHGSGNQLAALAVKVYLRAELWSPAEHSADVTTRALASRQTAPTQHHHGPLSFFPLSPAAENSSAQKVLWKHILLGGEIPKGPGVATESIEKIEGTERERI